MLKIILHGPCLQLAKILVPFDPVVEIHVLLKQVWHHIRDRLSVEYQESRNTLIALAATRVFELTGNTPTIGSIGFAYLIYYFQEVKFWYVQWNVEYLLDPTPEENKILHDLKPKYRRLLVTCFSENGRMMTISKQVIAAAPEVGNPLFDFEFIFHLGYTSQRQLFSPPE